MSIQAFQSESPARYVDAITSLVDRQLVPEAETFLALLSEALLSAMESGALSPAQADRLYVLLDARMAAHAGSVSPFSEAAQELIAEGESLACLEAGYGPSLDYMHQLAEAILWRRGELPSA